MANADPRGLIHLCAAEVQRYGRFEFIPGVGTRSVSCARIEGELDRCATSSLTIDENTFALMFVEVGASLLRCPARRWVVAPSGAVVFVQGPQELNVKFGKGQHMARLFWWRASLTPQIEGWLRSLESEGQPTLVAQPTHPAFTQAVERLCLSLSERVPIREMMFLSAAYELIPRLVEYPGKTLLAPLPSQLPEKLRGLVLRVEERPNQSWPMNDAAADAGFSTFHFSRIFRQLVGFGFPEYVDRCRTEAALRLLCETTSSLDEVVFRCGFGSMAALRESMREYIGMAPHEIRSL